MGERLIFTFQQRMFSIGLMERVHFQNDLKEVKQSVEGKMHSLTILVLS